MVHEPEEFPLLTVLAWKERWDHWHAVPQTSRDRLVRELARVMIQAATGCRHEHDEDSGPAP